MRMSTYKQLLQTGRELLKQKGIADADVDAWYLLAHVFQINRTDLMLKGDHTVEAEAEEHYLKLLKQRASRLPLQHILGTQEFMGLEFEVNQDVLIPRQDTETLVEEVLKYCEGKEVLDLCTGSGCIIISLAKLGRLRHAVGADLSEKALALAARNAHQLNVEVELIQSDLFERVDGMFDIIVSNPPYIPSGDIEALMPEVRDHEPRLALDGREDGLEFYRNISKAAKEHLKPEGLIFYEIGYNQGEAVREILTKEGFTEVTIKKDLSGLDRVVAGRRS
jgi:release factor glutamine methyltransferase